MIGRCGKGIKKVPRPSVLLFTECSFRFQQLQCIIIIVMMMIHDGGGTIRSRTMACRDDVVRGTLLWTRRKRDNLRYHCLFHMRYGYLHSTTTTTTTTTTWMVRIMPCRSNSNRRRRCCCAAQRSTMTRDRLKTDDIIQTRSTITILAIR